MSQTLDLEKYATASRPLLAVVNKAPQWMDAPGLLIESPTVDAVDTHRAVY